MILPMWAELSISACASDAFFPFADGLLAAAEAGATGKYLNNGLPLTLRPNQQTTLTIHPSR